MDAISSILLAVKPLHYQGQELIGEGWGSFLAELRRHLQENGFEDSDSTETLLLFTFTHPNLAITALFHFINKTRNALHLQGSDSSLPLQIIVHLNRPEEKCSLVYRNPKAGVWELLSPEAIHISKVLKSSWDLLMAKTRLPPITFSNEGDGLFKLQFAPGDLVDTEPLLSCRALSGQGNEQPCFYCGMMNHHPGQCPSKHLTMEHDGLPVVGYLPFPLLEQAYKKVFSSPEALNRILSAGITSSQIRKSAELMVLVGFLDINRIYQIRFLWNLTFSRFSKWQAVLKAEQIQPDNKNLQLGLDCLRVGKYKRAQEFLQQECHAKSIKRFSAAIGLAFVALETRGLTEMRAFLELAKSMATQAKERIYIDLLLSRFYELICETWKARDIVKALLASQTECTTEAMYRKLKLEVQGNFIEEACLLLRFLALDQRTLYMAALMDPALLPLQTKVEDLLSSQYDAKSSSAQELLFQADQGVTELSFWLDSQDPNLLSHKAILDNLQKGFQRKSYFDVLDVEYKATGLISSNAQLKETKLNELYDQLNQTMTTWEVNCHFWTSYRYQFLFKDFGRWLLPLGEVLQEASILAKKNEGETYKKSVHLLRKTEQVLVKLKHLQGRMNIVGLVCDSTIGFIKKLVLAEISGAILANVLILGLSQLPEGHALATLANAPLLQKQTFMLTAFMIAPFLALTLTIKDIFIAKQQNSR